MANITSSEFRGKSLFITVDADPSANGYDKVLVLWDQNTTPTYAEIGNWTQGQANARILELI